MKEYELSVWVKTNGEVTNFTTEITPEGELVVYPSDAPHVNITEVSIIILNETEREVQLDVQESAKQI